MPGKAEEKQWQKSVSGVIPRAEFSTVVVSARWIPSHLNQTAGLWPAINDWVCNHKLITEDTDRYLCPWRGRQSSKWVRMSPTWQDKGDSRRAEAAGQGDHRAPLLPEDPNRGLVLRPVLSTPQHPLLWQEMSTGLKQSTNLALHRGHHVPSPSHSSQKHLQPKASWHSVCLKLGP